MPSKFGYVGQHVTYNKYRNFFLEKILQRLRLPVEIRGFPGTGIFSCHQQLGL